METSTTEPGRRFATEPDTTRTLVVEFAWLNEVQRALVDLHLLRAVGTDLFALETDGVVIEFWLRDREPAHAAYDDIRGWAIGNGLPIRRMIED